jgi:hypothetical protein
MDMPLMISAAMRNADDHHGKTEVAPCLDLQRVRGGVHMHAGSELNLVADVDAVAVQHDAIEVEEAAAPVSVPG